MNEKTILTLEFPRVREALASRTSFSASKELALNVFPTHVLTTAQLWQRQTSEARELLSTTSEISLGGVMDIRPMVGIAERGGVLSAEDILDVKNTLISARGLLRVFDRLDDKFAEIKQVVGGIEPPFGVVDSISHCISDRGDILDHASDKLAAIRRDIKIAHERLLSRLERMINDGKTVPMLQESIITQRDGRYVIPLRAEFKGQIKSIIHDQSSSGATLFVEPLVVVELNNQYKELELAERDEEHRILASLSAQIGMHAAELHNLLIMLAELDLILARAKYADDLAAAEPLLYDIKPKEGKAHPGSIVRLYQARHPLLDPARVVPIDLDLDPDTYSLIITGPNTGGKTVTLKTIGIFALMAQSGMHIPALSGSAISIFHDIFADIGDEQSIEQSLSTFSGHITNIIQILNQADSKSLVLLDELGAGTDPQEGAALAMAILKNLLDRQITSMVATHYPELKVFAHNTPGVINASLEFDLSTLKPTYHLSLGLPGRSNALAIAEKLGLPEDIINLARSVIHPDELRAEDLLDEIYQQRAYARDAREQAQQSQHEAARVERELALRMEKIEDERLRILAEARNEVEAEAGKLRQELEEVRRALTRARQPLEMLNKVDENLDQVEEKTNRVAQRKPAFTPQSEIAQLRLGAKVHVISLNMDGVISALGENEVEVSIGRLRMRAKFSDIRKATKPSVIPEKPIPAAGATQSRTVLPERPASPGMELDLRGQRAEDALDMLERYLESAYSNGMPFVRIIHGKGTGRLRQVIREGLKNSPHVEKFSAGMENEGGDGVTVARLKND